MKREFDGKIRKVGNSFVVTIPINTVERYDLKENEFVTVLITDGKSIKKKRSKKWKRSNDYWINISLKWFNY